MSDFRQLSDDFWASPQIGTGDVERARAEGFSTIVNNRPDGESGDQTDGATIAAAARAAGLKYHAIPVDHAGFSESQVAGLREILAGSPGKVLAYCRSGTRSTLLWALTRASMGDDPAELSGTAARAGYDLGPVHEAMDMLAARGRD